MDVEPPSFLWPLFVTHFSYLLSLVLGALLLLLLLGSALISGAEVAFFSLTSRDLASAREKSMRGIDLIEKLLLNEQKLLATILIVNNFINICTVLLFSYLGSLYLHLPDYEIGGIFVPLQFLVEVVLITFVLLLVGEIIPKIYANKNALRFAAFMASPLQVLMGVCSPLSYWLLGSTQFIEKRFSPKNDLSVDHLSQALELTSNASNQTGNATDDQKILEGIVAFGSTDTSQIMTPRVDMFALKKHTSYGKVLEGITGNGYSRIPVYQESIDQIEGVLYVKDLIPYINHHDFAWEKLIKKPFFVPEKKKLDTLLNDFKTKKIHLAVVVDEYGGTSGIVTLEDVLEEIVGDISDEFDDHDLSYTKIDDTTYTFEGKTPLKDFYRVLDISEVEAFDKVKREAETLAGFLIELNEEFPKWHQRIVFNNYTFVVEAIDKKRVRQIKVIIATEEDA